MPVHRIRLLDAAARELEHLDKATGRRIVRRLNWLATNLDDLNPEPLKGDLSGLYKLRLGAYRILYEILVDEHLIVVHHIGHRKTIYRIR